MVLYLDFQILSNLELYGTRIPKDYNTSASIYLFQVTIRNSGKMCEIFSTLTIKTPKRSQRHCSGVFTVNFKHISHLFLLFLLLTWTGKCLLGHLNKYHIYQLFNFPKLKKELKNSSGILAYQCLEVIYSPWPKLIISVTHKMLTLDKFWDIGHYHKKFFKAHNLLYFPTNFKFLIGGAAHKMKFSIKISSVNMPKSAVSYRFGNIYWGNP